MRAVLRELLCLGVALVVSWWLFLRPPPAAAGVAGVPLRHVLPMELTPLLAAEEDLAAEDAATEEHAAPSALEPEEAELVKPLESPAAPPQAELGTPEGVPREEPASSGVQDPAPSRAPSVPAQATPAVSAQESARSEPPPESNEREESPPGEEPRPAEAHETELASNEPEPSSLELPSPQPKPASPAHEPAEDRGPPSPPVNHEPAGMAAEDPRDDETGASDEAREIGDMMRDPSLLAAAGAELAGEERRGFATVLLAAPEEQLAIARFFGEELVLVPRQTLDPAAKDPRWFRVASDAPRVEEVRGRPPLERYRQYRDLFDYEYARLPTVLRELRRALVSRRDVYVFAALIPAREWAVVIARRAEALARAGRELSEVRRFVLRYLELGNGAFDLAVVDIVFADGSRYTPPRPSPP